MWWAAWVGCLGEAEVADALEGGFRATNDAVALGLVATEIRAQSRLPPNDTTRHATNCGCPCRTVTGEGDFRVMSLGYHPEGCLPDSGLISGALWGTFALEVDGDDVRSDLGGGGVGLVDAFGAWHGPVTTDHVVTRGAVEVGGRPVELDLVSRWDGDRVALEGTVAVGPVTVELDLVVPREGLAARCPTPGSGTAVVDDGGPEVDLEFADDGTAVGRVRSHTSAPTDPCRFASDLF